MTLFLHVGTHKTATTYLQKSIKRNRNDLEKKNLIYPSLKLIGENDSAGHHFLGHALARDDKNNYKKTIKFARLMKEQSSAGKNVFLSTETFYRYKLDVQPRESAVQQRENYISKIASVFGGDSEIVIVLRRPDSFCQSVYQESTKKTSQTKTFEDYAHTPNMLLEYFTQISLFKKHFSKVHVLVFEDLIRGDQTIEANLLTTLGLIDDDFTFAPLIRANEGLHPFLVEYKRLLNFYNLKPAQSKKIVAALDEAQSEGAFGFLKKNVSFFSYEDRVEFLKRKESDLNSVAQTCFHAKSWDLVFPPIKDERVEKFMTLNSKDISEINAYMNGVLDLTLNVG